MKKKQKKIQKCTKKNKKKKYKKISHKKKKKSVRHMRFSSSSSISLNILNLRFKMMFFLCIMLLSNVFIPNEWMFNSSDRNNPHSKSCHHSKLLVKEAIPKHGDKLEFYFHPDGIAHSSGINQMILNDLSENKFNHKPDMTANKILNRRRRAINGNRQNEINVIHWNLGSKLWQNKVS